ncbi:MBG domain-containing protein [Gilvimarinus agarilyticus]|uniref:MBG domain-containing protein n=1 Tax=Gilvimarinus agarilyticus TaxID=679259 RepID=UPI000696FBB4|nr:MBG domain-containing protein [Gilvimarinus agarilyticus]
MILASQKRLSQRASQPYRPRLLALTIGLLSGVAHAGPTGGVVIDGDASIDIRGKLTDILQNTQNTTIVWDNFDINADEIVNFIQPNDTSIALNRVLSADGTQINGQLNANGRVFVLDANGVLFGESAQVSVGGLVASTLDLSHRDYDTDTFTFTGKGAPAAVTNLGKITAADTGAVALLGGRVSNHGVIQAKLANVALAAGNQVTLDFAGDGLLNVQVDEAALNALAENHGLIQADGGQVLMTAHASDALLQTVVNNEGVIEAQTLQQQGGKIVLRGGFNGGTVQVAGTLDASAPEDGDAGFIDTSGAQVQVADEVSVTTRAASGDTGEWLIDPTDFHVSEGSAAQTSSGIGAETLSNNLATTNVTLQTVASGSEVGDIYVDGAVSWNAGTTLTLDAHNDIFINAPITVQNSGGGLALEYGGSGYAINAPVSFSAGSGGHFSVNGSAFTLIHDVVQLQAMDQDLAGRYALATDIDASATAGWHGGAGFVPVGNLIDSFNGELDGLGHVVDGLTIKRPGENAVGLFGVAGGARLANLGLTNVQVQGDIEVGGLVGQTSGSTIERSHARGSVTGGESTGGLVGRLNPGARVSDSHADVRVIGAGTGTGGLAGSANSADILRSHASGDVTGVNETGGLVGDGGGLNSVLISESYASGAVSGTVFVGGLVGRSAERSTIELSYATGAVSGSDSLGGLVGSMGKDSTIDRSWASGRVGAGDYAGGLVGIGVLEATVTDSYWDTQTTGQAEGCFAFADCSGGATGLTTSEALDQSQYANLDFSNDWFMLDGDTRPFLRSEYATTITNSHQLQLMAMDLSADYLLAEDVDFAPALRDPSRSDMWATSDMAGKGFAPIGDEIDRFTGTLDGLGFVVQALTIDRSGRDFTGLFGGVDGARLTGIGLSYVDVTGKSYVGALVGNAINSNIYDSYVSGGAVTGTLLGVGGLIGSGSGRIENSYTNVDVYADSGIAGGLMGGGRMDISSSYASGNVSSPLGQVGGLVGQYNGGTLSNSYATGRVSGSNPVGGAVGNLIGYGSISNVFWNHDANPGLNGVGSDVSALGVTGKTLAELQTLSTFTGAGWDIDTQGGTGRVWRLYEGHSTPLLRGFLTELNISASDSSTTYTGAMQTGDGVWEVAGPYDTGLILGTATNTGGGIDAGTYSLGIEGVYSTQQGYDITLDTGTLTINKAPLTLTANSDTVTYSGVSQSVTGYTATGFVGGEDASVLTSITASGGIGTNAGSYAHTLGGSDDNYDLTFVDGALTVSPRDITLAVSDASKVYGEHDPGFSATIEAGSLAPGDSWSADYFRAAGENVGRYRTHATPTGDLASGNYTVTTLPGELRITPRDITLTVNNTSKIYGESDPVFSSAISAGSLAFSDALTVSYSRTVGEDVGDYTVSATFAGALASGNYNVALTSGTLQIVPRDVDVIVNIADATKIYGEADPTFSWAISAGSLAPGDSLEGVLSRETGENVGHYTITGALTGALATDNYTVTVSEGLFRILPRDITLTVNDTYKTYGDLDPALSGRITQGSLAFTDTLSAEYSRAPGEDAGNYTATALLSGALAGGNYNVTLIPGTFSITPREVDVIVGIDNASKVYGDLDPDFTWSITSGDLAAGDTLSGNLSREPGENVGRYTIYGELSGDLASDNYTVSVSEGELRIIPRDLTVTVSDANKVYGSADPTFNADVTVGALAFDDVATWQFERQTGENVGNYSLQASASGAIATANYNVSWQMGELTINPVTLEVTALDTSRVWGDLTDFEYQVSGLTNGDTLDDVLDNIQVTYAINEPIPGVYPLTPQGDLLSENYHVNWNVGTLELLAARATQAYHSQLTGLQQMEREAQTEAERSNYREGQQALTGRVEGLNLYVQGSGINNNVNELASLRYHKD